MKLKLSNPSMDLVMGLSRTHKIEPHIVVNLLLEMIADNNNNNKEAVSQYVDSNNKRN
ncbi:TPA: hypothetical protein ACX6R8_001341 [Photobacterium damselae]